MKFQDWRSLWRFDREVDIPHLSINVMCPWLFVRLLWYHCTKEFKAWPNQHETGLVIGWRWPFQKQFREKAWLKGKLLPLALYGAMDGAYTRRAMKELGWDYGQFLNSPYIAAAIRELKKCGLQCSHDYWIANCPDCARRAMTLAVLLTSKLNPRSVPDPCESPIDAFQRREAEAKRLEAERSQKCLK